MIRSLRRHTVSFKNAFEGLLWVLRTQHNYSIHIVLSIIALLLGLFLHISYYEFLIVILLIFSGLTIETVNTAIEEATDAIDTKWREDIKIAKDVAAGAMLIYSFGALVIALIIFVPKLLAYLAF